LEQEKAYLRKKIRLFFEENLFSHDICDGDFFLCPSSENLIVFGFQVGIAPDRDRRRREEIVAQVATSILYGSLSLPFCQAL